jgi:hypothetical protein
MDPSMKVSLWQVLDMVTAGRSTQMALLMRESGLTTRKPAQGLKRGPMAPNLLDHSYRIRKQATAYLPGQTTLNTRETCLTINLTDRESIHGAMGMCTTASGLKTTCTELASLHGRMAESTKETM